MLVAVLLLVLLGCGDDDAVGTTSTENSLPPLDSTTTGPPGPPPPSESTTTIPDSISVAYVCGNGEDGSAEIPAGDLEVVDDAVNTIDLCEFRGGLAEISLTAPCPSGDRDVTVPAVDGAVPDFATLDLCEDTG
jgi:hypothetical protein